MVVINSNDIVAVIVIHGDEFDVIICKMNYYNAIIIATIKIGMIANTIDTVVEIKYNSESVIVKKGFIFIIVKDVRATRSR